MLEKFFSGIMYMKMLKSLSIMRQNLSIVSLVVVHCQELSSLADWNFLVFLRETYKIQISSISSCNYHIIKKIKKIVLRFCLFFFFFNEKNLMKN